MQIEIPNEQFEKLTEVAVAAGYEDATAFITALAEQPARDPRGELNATAIRETAAQCDRSMTAIADGQGKDAIEAMRELGRERGFKRGE